MPHIFEIPATFPILRKFNLRIQQFGTSKPKYLTRELNYTREQWSTYKLLRIVVSLKFTWIQSFFVAQVLRLLQNVINRLVVVTLYVIFICFKIQLRLTFFGLECLLPRIRVLKRIIIRKFTLKYVIFLIFRTNSRAGNRECWGLTVGHASV